MYMRARAYNNTNKRQLVSQFYFRCYIAVDVLPNSESIEFMTAPKIRIIHRDTKTENYIYAHSRVGTLYYCVFRSHCYFG